MEKWIDFFKKLFTSDFMPHGHCFFWRPEILWLHVISDIVIALAYFFIPFLLIYFVRKRKDLNFRYIFVLFGAFIMLCGTTHIMAAYVMWDPVYRLDGLIKVATALVSVATGIALLPMIPKTLKLPSPASLQKINKELQAEIEKKEQAQLKLKEINSNLEAIVKTRTAELEEYTAKLQAEIRDRKKYEEDLAEANERLKEFAYVVSHDLKSPLRAIGSLTDFLEMDYKEKLDKEGRMMLKSIKERAVSMDKMINAILDYSRIGSLKGEKEMLDPNKMIEDIKTALSPPDNMEIRVKGALPLLFTDPFPLYQVFQNLIQNAIKYNNKEQGWVEIGAQVVNDELVFSVTDNGEGIPETYLPKIFQLFQTSAAQKGKEGTGIGLSVVKRVVEMLEGKISVESKEDQYTTFKISLPGKLLVNDTGEEKNTVGR